MALNESGREAQRLASCGGLDGFQVQAIGRMVADQLVDFLADLRRKRLFEPPFLAASVEAA